MLVRQSATTKASNFPPPIVPDVLPSLYTIIFDPLCRGTEPAVAATVASAQRVRFWRATNSSSRRSSFMVAAKAPSTNIQHPMKLQTSNSKRRCLPISFAEDAGENQVELFCFSEE